MDIKKLIDDADFDNLNQLSKRWKKESNHTSLADSQFSMAEKGPSNEYEKGISSQVTLNYNENSKVSKQNIQKSSNVERQTASYQMPKKKREVMPQIIDEDTQHFRNRLQTLLNAFKTDAVSEFMGMKKSMIEYQKDTIKSDTQKYLTMYEQKHQELLQAKDQLINLTSDVERKTMQIELMSNHIAKLNQRVKITRYLSRPFALLYQNKERQKMIKFKMAEAATFDKRRLKLKSLNGWRNIFRENQKERQNEINNNKVQQQVADIVNRYQKEMEILREKLAEANRKNQQYENNKQLIQDNLKKAFLRGISSMNMEAMGIFSTNQLNTSEHQHGMNNNSYMEHNSLGLSRADNTNLNMTSPNLIQHNTSIVTSKPKIQSKDHKWKQAPILGIQEKYEAQEPRPQVVKPSSEAKVIRVIDGRSNVELPSGQTSRRGGVTAPQSGSKTEIGRRR